MKYTGTMRAAGRAWMASASMLWAAAAGADEEAKAPPAQENPASDLREGAEADLDAKVSRLLGLARQAFEARDYAASRHLALAATRLRPENQEALEIHRLSILYGEKLASIRPQLPRRIPVGEGTDESLERLSRAFPWSPAPAGSRARPPAEAKEAPKADWQVQVEKKLAEKGSVGFKDAPFSEVKEYLEASLGCPVVVDRRMRAEVMALPVHFQAKDMPFEQILGWIVENDLGLRYVLVDGAVYISDADGITEKAGVIRVYDVADLLYESQMPDFVGPSLDLRDGVDRGMGVRFDTADGETPPPPRGMTADRLMRIIERTVEPGTWKREEKSREGK